MGVDAHAVNLRRRPSYLGLNPMVSPTSCPNLSPALRLKFFPPPMVIAVGVGPIMINCIVEESVIGHRQATATARRHGICRSLPTTWRRQYRNGELGSSRPVSLAPVTVTVTKESAAPRANPVNSCSPSDCQVEIALPDGRRLIVPADVETEALARILAVVDGQ